MKELQVSNPVDSAPSLVTNEVEAFLEKLERLTDFWAEGVLSDQEFSAAKARLAGTAPRATPDCWECAGIIPLD